MWKIRKWFERKSVSKKEYEAEKREFEMAIGKPFITLKIELPEGPTKPIPKTGKQRRLPRRSQRPHQKKPTTQTRKPRNPRHRQLNTPKQKNIKQREMQH
jgi:hypothetical protein